ncbi:MAG: IS21-like element helper ATPase IstB [Anaerovoracaceae bacterium]
MYSNEIKTLCKDLRLGSILMEYEGITANNHEEFLYKLLMQLKEKRDISGINRRTRAAGFEVIKFLKDFDFNETVLPGALNIESLSACLPFKAKENLIMYGRPGTGKTHLATALGMNAINLGMNVIFRKTSRLVNELKENRVTNRSSSFWKRLDKADVLILDEWGYIPFERVGTQLLFEAISSCYEKKSIVITTNLPFDEWNTIFYDEKLTTAILDRIVHHGHLIMHNGASYRVRHSKMQ